MSLKDQIGEGIKQAMRAKEKEKLEALRAVKSALLLLETDKNAGEINEEAEIKLLQRLVKQRKESAEIYISQGRADLADPELFQADVISEFLPKQLSEDELKAAVQAIIESVGAASMADMGKVMGVATKDLAGKSDGKSISAMVKQLLS